MVAGQDLTLVFIGYALAEMVGICLVADAVMRTRSSKGAIAWSVALVSMPLLAVPSYLVFGRPRFEGYAEALRQAQARVGAQASAWHPRMAEAASLRPELESLESVVRRLTGFPFVGGNRVDLLIDAAATYQAMLDAIESARSYVLIQFYIVNDDDTGRRFRDALMERARAGVRVRFLYDEIGSWALPEAYLEGMREQSIEVSGFKTTRGVNNRFQINFRNHRKLLVVDGGVGFVGGLNLGDEYLGYRDTHLRIEGPAVQQIQLSFLKDWFWATRTLPEVSFECPATPASNTPVAVITTGPADGVASCSILFSTMIGSARHRLWLCSPYFVPDDVSVRALQASALRGVDVRVILPAKADHRLVQLASCTYYQAMMDCGVRIYRHEGRFMHQKVILVDDDLAGIGTVNLDYRSLYLNFEATAVVADVDFVAGVAAMLRSDLQRCTPVEPDYFDRKPLWFRVAARSARLLSPLL